MNNILGSKNSDNLTGNSNANIIHAGLLDDTIEGLAGNDTIYGQAGDDVIDGSSDLDTLYGGSGDDTFIASLLDGNDVINGFETTGTESSDDKDTIDYSAIDDSSYHLEVNLSNSDIAGVLNNSANIKQDLTTEQTDTISNIENIIGTNGNDTIIGSSEANQLKGEAGDDTFIGGAGNDQIIGGAHTVGLNGGDWVDYSYSLNNIYTDLNSENRVYIDTDGVTGFGVNDEVDTLSQIENIKGSDINSKADTIIGNSEDNSILGLKGDDTIDGGDGSDYLDGGEGINTLSFESLNESVSVDLSNSSATTSKHSDTIKNFTNIIGTDLSSQEDILIGDDNNNTIKGLAGNDTLEGKGGVDNLFGGSGNDTFILGINDGEDTIDGEDGSSDTVDYSSLNSSESLNLDLDTSTATTATITNGSTTFTDSVVNIENIKGGSGDDRLTGDAFKNSLWGNAGDDILDGDYEDDKLFGGSGNDTLLGGLGDDELYGQAGDDNLSGGAGNDIIDGGETDEIFGDTIDYSSKTTNLDINLKKTDGSYATAYLDTEQDKLANIENIVGTIYDDKIIGNEGKNRLEGKKGDDTLAGDTGDDTLFGNEGDDTFIAGIYDKNLDDFVSGNDGNDYYDGGEGQEDGNADTLDYSAFDSSKNIEVDLSATDSLNSDYATVNVNDGTTDYVKNIENIIGSKGNDIISGDAQNNILNGSLGDDTLKGNAGNDTIIGGEGQDKVDYSDALKGIVVDLRDAVEVSQDGFDFQDNLSGIEILEGSDFADSLTGSNSNDTFIGANGNDKFFSTKGSDTFYGGSLDTNGTHTIEAGEYNKIDYEEEKRIYVDLSQTKTDSDGNIYSEVLKSNSNLTSDGFTNLESTDKVYSIVNINGTTNDDTIIGNSETNFFEGDSGADKLEGKGGDDNLKGEAGNDTFVATSADDGSDTIDGGEDSDTIDYSKLTSNSIEVSLAEDFTVSTVFVKNANNDSIVNIENVIGTQVDDTITGNSKNNTLIGKAGDDTLEGGRGDDLLDGGINSSKGDTVSYSKANSSVSVDLGLNGISQNISVEQGNDTLTDIENVIGSAYNDIFYSNENANNSFDGGITDSLGGDTVDYSKRLLDSDDKIVANLETNSVQITDDLVVTANDSLTSIENITGTAGNDTITGNSDKNTLKGEAGDDIIEGGAGDDYIDGGVDNLGDTVYYNNATSGVNVDLGIDGTAQTVGGGQGVDTLVDIEHVIGSSYADTFKGNNTESNTFDGGKDLDSGVENINDENDTVDYSKLTSNSDKIVVDLSNTNKDNVAVTVANVAQGSDTLINIENVIGTSGDDTFTGNSDSNNLQGGDGDDTFFVKDASSSNEIDTINGGNNTSVGDTVDFSKVTNYYVDVNLSSQDLLLKDSSNVVVRDDNVLNIENITGTQNEDKIIGDSSKNILKGEGGTDTIKGEVGDDIIYGSDNTDNALSSTDYELLDGGEDNDTIYGGAGNDSILGGTGVGEDSLYGEAGNDIIKGGSGVDFIDGGDNDDYINGEAGVDELRGGLGTDEIYGGTEGDTIYGDNIDSNDTQTSNDNDTIFGEDGVDYIYGGFGDDTLSGGANNDYIYGGFSQTEDSGTNDTVTYENATNSVVVDFVNNKATGEGTDELYGIENAIGSKYDDTFISKLTVSNRFDGGDDESGEINGDSISYEEVNVDSTDDKVVIDLSTSADAQGYYKADIYQDGAVVTSDYLKNMENITGTNGNDTITGDDDKNTLVGLDGDDTLSGQGGNDVLNGGAGNDTASFIEKNVAVEVDFKTNKATTSTETDTLIDIENAIGGSSSDTFKMNEDNKTNIINGGDTAQEDTVSYEYYTTNGITVNLSTTQAQTVIDSSGTTDIDTILNIQNITGSSKDDKVIGSSEDNSIVLGSGNDTFIAGTDTNNDGILESGDDGVDYFDGGVGTSDWADYSVVLDDLNSSTNGIEVTLDGANEAQVNVNGQTSSDTILNVEHIKGTQDSDSIKGDVQNNSLVGQAGNDILSGEAGIDRLQGEIGDDTLLGGSGDDILEGGDGNDTLTGGVGSDKIYGGTYDDNSSTHTDTGNGVDTVDYTNALESLTIDLDVNATGGLDANGTEEGRSDGAIGDQGQGIDELYGIENVIGSNFASDTIFGSDEANIIESKAYDDYVETRAGNDTVYAGSGDDTILATNANDGVDYIDGSSGVDTIDYSKLNESINLDLSGAASVAFDGGVVKDSWEVIVSNGDNDVVKDVENVIGSSVDDTIIGNSKANEIQGGLGADFLSGNGGNDEIYGYKKDQSETTIEYDTVSYEYLTSKSVDIDLQAGTAVVDTNDKDNLYSIENVIGGNSNDKIAGSDVKNILQGNSGDDSFISSLSDDIIYGGKLQTDGSHIDTSNSDTIDYSNEINDNNKIFVDLGTTLADGFSQVKVSSSSDMDFTTPNYTDKVYGIENINGTNNNDTILGNDETNTLEGNGGSDTLKGAGGADKLIGGSGDDMFIIDNTADATGDEIIGGDNYDTVNYQGVDQGITVNLDGVTTATVDIAGNTHTLTQIEYVIGTEYNDDITGDFNLNKIQGMGGDDTISGQAGSDKLYGGADIANSTNSGSDTLDGKAGDDTIYAGDGDDKLLGGDGKDILYAEEGADEINAENGDDTVYAGSGDDEINGGLGADTIYAGLGNDTITFEQADNKQDIVYGGDESNDSGIDTVDYSQAITGMTVNLAEDNEEGTATSQDQGTDKLYGIENIVGSNLGKDTITGNSEKNIISGMGADDTIYAKEGEDTIYGGDNNDLLYGGEGNDSIDGQTGDDTVYGQAGDDTLTGGSEMNILKAI